MPCVSTQTPPSTPTRVTRKAAAAFAALALADTYLAGQPSAPRRALRVLTKPAMMPALMLAFARGTQLQAPATPTRRHVVTRTGTLVAQGLSGGGDVALLSKAEPAFLAGVGSFFGAHVAYTATFLTHGRPLSDPTGRGATLATLAGGGALVPAVSWAAGRRAPGLRGPVAAYAAMITAMVGSSTRLSDDVPEQARRRILAGTALFLASDSVLAVRKFLLHDPRPWSDGVVMATYTAGQGLIALGLAQVARAPRPADAAPPARVEETDG
jgi:uncharacterized membrane protein YhhN